MRAHPTKPSEADRANRPADVPALLAKYPCAGCHADNVSWVGLSCRQIAAKYAGAAGATARLEVGIQAGVGGVWGPLPMPAQQHVPLRTALRSQRGSSIDEPRVSAGGGTSGVRNSRHRCDKSGACYLMEPGSWPRSLCQLRDPFRRGRSEAMARHRHSRTLRTALLSPDPGRACAKKPNRGQDRR